MEVIANQTMSETVVQIDGRHFENCVIERSVLVFSGGDFSWTNCKFVSCQVRLVGAAKRTIDFLRNFGMVPRRTPSTAEAAGSSSIQ